MDRIVSFKVFSEDELDWLEIKNAILRRHGQLRGRMGKTIIELCKLGLERTEEMGEKEKTRAISKRKANRLAAVFKNLPDMFPPSVLDRILEKHGGVTSSPAKADYKNFLRGWGMIYEHHVNPTGKQVFEKGKFPEWLNPRK